MPTVQSTTTSAQNPKNAKVENKIAKAVAKVEQAKTLNTQEQASSGGASTSGNKTPQDQPEFIKQSLIIVEKKVRNLEKRKSKLDEYKESQRKGTVLNEDQLLAVSRYDEVTRTLELSRELEKQFIGLASDALKQQKKQAKKEHFEREEAVREKLRESHKINSLLNTFGDETVRNDFLNETNGAFLNSIKKLTQQEVTLLDEFNKLVQPSDLGTKLEASSSDSAEHLLNLIEGRSKQITPLSQEIVGQVTYSDLKKLFERIFSSSYWNQEQQQLQQQAEEEQQQPEQVEQEQTETLVQTEQQQENLTEQISNLNLNTNQLNEQQADNNGQAPFEQQQQQNTSEDYVIVNTNDFNENTQSKLQQSPNQQQHTQEYLTTLNPTSNINEFLQTNDEGINFLQDSEIQHRQQQQELQQEQLQQQPTDNYQAPQQPQLSNYQENNQNEGQREFRGNSRGGHRDYNGNNPRNYDQRRSYEPRRNVDGNYKPRSDNNRPRGENGPRSENVPRSDYNGPRGENGQRSDNNGPRGEYQQRNGGDRGGYRGGNRGGYRGGYAGGNQTGPRTGSGGNQTGPRTGSGGNQYPRQQRTQDPSSQQLPQTVAQN